MAGARIRGITIEIGGDTSQLVKSLRSADTAIKQTQSNLRDINKALKIDPSNTNLLKDKQRELAAAIDETKNKLQAEKEMLEKMRNTEGFDANSQAARNLQTQIDLDTAALKELEAQARQSSSVLGTQMQLAGEKIKAVGDKIKGVGDKIASIGSSLTNTVTMPIVGAFGASAKAAIDWESAFTGVMKTVDASAAEYDQLAENIKKMATETASSKNDIAGVMEIAGQLGITGVDGLTTFTKTMVELGDTTNLSAEEAATALARFMNITGEASTDVDKIGSAVVDLGNNFATSESEIVSMATRLASAGTIAGMSSTDILALSAAMSSVGIQAEAGGTAMTQTLSAMTAAVAAFEAGSTEDLEAIANVANMSAQDFANAWNNEPVTAVQAFIAGLGTLDEKGENATLVLDELGMSGVRQSNMLKSLSLASGVLTDAIETSSNAYKENTALSDEASKRYGTMAAKISQAKERVTELAIEIGEMLMPYLEKGLEKIEGWVNKWKSLTDAQKQSILKFAAIAAAIGPALIVVGKLVGAFGSIVKVVGMATSGIGKLITFVQGAGGVMGALKAAIAAIASPVGIVVAAIAALAAAFVYLYTTSEEFKNSINEAIGKLKEQFAQTVEQLRPIWEMIKQGIQSVMTAIEPVIKFISVAVLGLVSGILAALAPMLEFIVNLISTIANIVKGLFALLNGDFEGFKTYMLAALTAFGEAISALIQSIVAFWVSFFQMFGINLQTLFTNIWNGIKLVVQTALTNISQAIQTKWNAIKTWLFDTLTKIKEKFEEIFDRIKEAVEERIDKVKTTIIEGVQKAVDFIKELPSKFYSWGSDMVQNLIDGIKSKIEAVKAAVSELASTISSYIHFSVPDKGALADADTYMPDFMNLLASGINAGIPDVERAMNNLTSSMRPEMPANVMNGDNTVTINVYGAQGQDMNQLADIIEQRISENVVRRGVAFA